MAVWNAHELQVVHEWIHRDSQNRPLGAYMRYCPYCCYQRTCVVSLYVTFAWSIALAVIILIACGVLIVEPWRHTLRYQEATCRVEKSEYTGETVGCRCGQYCRAHFPCLRVTVTYVPADDGSRKSKEPREVRTMLYESEFDRELSGTCTYAPSCTASLFENAEDVGNYKRSLGSTGRTFVCLYDAKNRNYVIRVRHGTGRVLHVILWPTLGILGFSIGILLVYLTCGCRYIWNLHPTEIIRQEALSRTFETIAIAPYQNLGESV